MDKLELLKRFEKLPTGNIADAMRKLGVTCKTVIGLHPLNPEQKRGAGYAVTVQQMERSVDQEKAVLTKHGHVIDTMLGMGDLLVIDVGGKETPCTGGALLAMRANMLGAAGFLVNGCLRDLGEIRKLGFPVYLKGGSPVKSSPQLETVGINVPVEINGTQIVPGDLIVMDETGVVVVPPQYAERVCQAAEEILTLEEQVEGFVRQGYGVEESFDLAMKQ